MGGYSEPVGSTGDLVQGGWTIGFGLTYQPSPSPVAYRFDFGYTAHNATHQALQQASIATRSVINGGYADIWSGTANVQFENAFNDKVHGYVVGGIGAYYTRLSATQNGVGYICDIWGFCYIGTGTFVTHSSSTTKFGWNAGAGVNFPLSGGASWFIEARFTAIETKHTFEYVPIQIGMRF
jgi:opacity protein-like surface antigen